MAPVVRPGSARSPRLYQSAEGPAVLHDVRAVLQQSSPDEQDDIGAVETQEFRDATQAHAPTWAGED